MNKKNKLSRFEKGLLFGGAFLAVGLFMCYASRGLPIPEESGEDIIKLLQKASFRGDEKEVDRLLDIMNSKKKVS